jgi:hypothetical protein
MMIEVPLKFCDRLFAIVNLRIAANLLMIKSIPEAKWSELSQEEQFYCIKKYWTADRVMLFNDYPDLLNTSDSDIEKEIFEVYRAHITEKMGNR